MARNGCCERLGLSERSERPRGREEAKALKHSLPPPPPFCPRHQNKRADTRVPMTLVYYQDSALHAPLGYVVQPVSLAYGFPEQSKTETTNPQAISGAKFGLGPRSLGSNPIRSAHSCDWQTAFSSKHNTKVNTSPPPETDDALTQWERGKIEWHFHRPIKRRKSWEEAQPPGGWGEGEDEAWKTW